MEIFFVCMVLVIPVFLIIGMIKPKWFIPNRFNIRKRRLLLFFFSSALFLVCAICGTIISEKNMTPEEKIARDQQYAQARIEREQKKAEKDSLEKIMQEEKARQKEYNGSISNENLFIETRKGDIILGNYFSAEVLKIKDKKGVGIVLDRGYGKYRYYYLKITNNSQTAKDIYRRYFYLIDENNNIYQHNASHMVVSFFTTIKRDAFGAGEALPPKVPADGVIAFEVPQDGKYKLILAD